MAEFAATGTAVGIISLGIQTCQILHNYYSKYKSHGADIDNVLNQVQALQGSIESLHNAKTRFRIEDYEPSSQLQQALKVCQEALNELRVIADKCTTQQPTNIQARIKNAKKRILWPFKKEVLESLQATLSRAQYNLSFILQIAGIDVVSHKINGIHPVLNTINQQGVSINQSMVQATNSLHSLRLDVLEVSKVQNQYTTLLVNGFTELQNSITGQIATLTPLIVSHPLARAVEVPHTHQCIGAQRWRYPRSYHYATIRHRRGNTKPPKRRPTDSDNTRNRDNWRHCQFVLTLSLPSEDKAVNEARWMDAGTLRRIILP
jgi:hypothetical protein